MMLETHEEVTQQCINLTQYFCDEQNYNVIYLY